MSEFDPRLIQSISDAFDTFDPDHSGRLDVREAGTVLRSLGVYPTEAEIHKFILQMQRDEPSLWIQKSIFQDFAANLISENVVTGPTQDELREAFQALDAPGTGMIEVEQLLTYLTTIGEKLSQEEAEAFSSFAAKDGPTGKVVEWGEYVQSLKEILWK
ncbi:Calmodulin [Spironucleus salmonicida]|uniref:Calmodulin n=1 Tax=Spironucleus salmonicida TaxID=348837 RepID=V6LVC0_9EUKA|nr:Calmodulin [Spironucleus salmonicida]|eukprot:EST48168.1 Calmodulin [Spironucleus salmonicida]